MTQFATWPFSKSVARFKASQLVLKPVDLIPNSNYTWPDLKQVGENGRL